jgi:hypothetical protein
MQRGAAVLPVDVDFYDDWVELLRRELRAAGYPAPSGEPAHDVCFRYYNWKKRSISSGPRKVVEAKDFSAPADLKAGVDLVREKFEKGQDLRPHLSRRIADLNYDNALLDDWGIHHLHLGTTIDSFGFVPRTGPDLFAKVEADQVYFLAVLGHGQWSNQLLVEILHSQFSDSIKQFRLPGFVVDVQIVPSDAEVRALRKGNVSTIIRTRDGALYAPLGGGITTSGLSAQVAQIRDYYFGLMKKLEQHIVAKAAVFEEQAKRQGAKLGERLHFRLHHSSDGWLGALEENTKVLVRLVKLG